MKNLFKILILSLLVLSCSDDHNVIIDDHDVIINDYDDVIPEADGDSVRLKWIGCFECCGNEGLNECLWYIGSFPTPPSTFEGDGWDINVKCSQIELFEPYGYFNFITIEDPNYIGAHYINLSGLLGTEWYWEEE